MGRHNTSTLNPKPLFASAAVKTTNFLPQLVVFSRVQQNNNNNTTILALKIDANRIFFFPPTT